MTHSWKLCWKVGWKLDHSKFSEVASINDVDALAEVAQNDPIRNFDEC